MSGVEAAFRVKSYLDPERDECAESTLDAGAKRDPLLRSFSASRDRQRKPQCSSCG
jgi:hypothetical protein